MAKCKASAICVGVLAAALLSCGDDGDGSGGGSGGGGGSYSGISSNLAKPSGKLEATNTVSVAEEYEKISTGGSTEKQLGAQTVACAAGGNYKVNAGNVSSTSVTATVTYNKCCQQASCCLDGDADWFYATAGGASDYQYCGRYDVTSTCGSTTQPLKYEGCFGPKGWEFLVRVGGKTYAVTGSYVNGNGKLTIKDSTATWTCTYKSDKGSCTGGAAPIEF